VLAVLDDVLDTLSAAHTAGVIHRDLKPANMFLVRQAHGEAYVRILDFGLAKRSVPGGPRGQRASMVAGTPHYMAPEQALGEVVGPRADLYSVGCIAYEMLTGRLPFDTEDPVEQIARRLSSVPERAARVARVPAELDEIVMRLLERDPSHRPASAAVVRQQLAKYRRILQNESTVMGPRPLADDEPDSEDPTARMLSPNAPTPQPERNRVTVRTPRLSPLALGLAAIGVVGLLGVLAAVVVLPGGPQTQELPEAVDEQPLAGDDEAAPPEKLDEPRPPPPADEPPGAKPAPQEREPEPTPAPVEARPSKPSAGPKAESQPAQPRPKPEARPAADSLEARRRAALSTLAKVESKHQENAALMNTVRKIREAVKAARTEAELKKAVTRIEDELPVP